MMYLKEKKFDLILGAIDVVFAILSFYLSYLMQDNFDKIACFLMGTVFLLLSIDRFIIRNKKIQIKYHSDKIEPLKYIDGKSDWIDLRAAEAVTLHKGDFALINLGVSMKLPSGYEAHIVPRSSTFKNYGIIQTNHMAVIDESYCGNDDIWKYPVYALRDTTINIGDRICQFRIARHQPELKFIPVEKLGNTNRGGFGSTGKK